MGNKVWEKTIGDSGNDYGVTIKPTSDGGFIITGWTDSYGRGDDVLLLKIDANGNKQWSQAFGGPLEDRGDGRRTDDRRRVRPLWVDVLCRHPRPRHMVDKD